MSTYARAYLGYLKKSSTHAAICAPVTPVTGLPWQLMHFGSSHAEEATAEAELKVIDKELADLQRQYSKTKAKKEKTAISTKIRKLDYKKRELQAIIRPTKPLPDGVRMILGSSKEEAS